MNATNSQEHKGIFSRIEL